MEVVGCDDLDVELVGEVHELLVEGAVVEAVPEVKPVVLDLHVEVVAEDVLEGLRPLARLVELAVEDALLDDALDAGALADESLVVLLQHVQRGAGLVVHHLVAGGLGHALDEVDVARLVLREQDQVVAALRRAALDAVVGDEVGLAAEDRLDLEARAVGAHGLEVVCALLPHPAVALPLRMDGVEVGRALGVGLGLLELPPLLEALDVVAPLLHVLLVVVVLAALEVELGNAEHVAVVGQRDGRHLELDGALHHVGDARGGVEDREARVVVKVDECHESSFVWRGEGTGPARHGRHRT